MKAVFLILLMCASLFLATVPAVAQSNPEFSLAISPAVVALPQGALTSINLTFESNESPAYNINLSGLPEGVQAQVGRVRADMGTVVLFASPEAALGTFVVQVTARSGKNSQTQILTLNVTPLQPAPQWEYMMATANTDVEFLPYANSLGAQGWELVSVRINDAGNPVFVAFFKRIKR